MAVLRKMMIAVALLACMGGATTVATGMTANPIRKIVTMLQMMENKIKAEGEKQEKLFEQYMCYCKTNEATLSTSISDSETKIPQLESTLEETDAAAAQMVKDLAKHKTDREAAKKAIATATEVREKEAAAFAEKSGDYTTNIAAMKKAVAAIEKGSGSAFLQTSSAAVLRKITESDESVTDTDREVLVSFLSQGDSNDDEEMSEMKSGEIVGILKQQIDTMSKDLEEITATETKAVEDYNGMVAAQQKAISSLTAGIEDKITRIGESGVEVANLKEDIEDTQKALADDTKYLADLKKNCAAQKEGYAVVVKMRAEELLAIADTIKMLNSDEALELFKKTLPAASMFLQMQVTSKQMTTTALKALKQQGKKHHDYRIDLIALALKGKAADFSKVLGMIDDMVKLLGKEQEDDDAKLEYCKEKLDKTEDNLKELKHATEDLGKEIEDVKSDLETTKSDLKALAEGIEDLDKAVTDATEIRKEENSDYQTSVAANTAARDLIQMAKDRMAKVYGLVQVSQKITSDTSDSAPPPPPPAAVGAYSAKKEEGGGVMAMMTNMINDVDKELTEMEVNEKNAQEEYEQLLKDSADKRAADSQAITDKESAKAGMEESLVKLMTDNQAKTEETMATAEYLSDTHADCDPLIEDFDARKQARVEEVDSLKKAKAVLSGADFALVQTRAAHAVVHRLRGH